MGLTRTGVPYTPLHVAIVGGGYSGTLVAVHLLHQHRPVHIDLIDPRLPGRGLAYSTVWDDHLLNVPAVRMSAFASEPMHFLDWLHASGRPDASVDSFAPRKLYGSYLQDVLQSAVRDAGKRSRFRHHCTRAVHLIHDGTRARISLENGSHIEANRVVLATGNPAPRPLKPALAACFGSPWDAGAFAGLEPDRDVLLLGAGLTAVDAFLVLESQGHTGTIHCISRRGKLPHAHITYRSLTEPFPHDGAKSARDLLHFIRSRVQERKALGYDWRAVIDSMRPATNDLWCSLPAHEQARVLRHLKTWWDIHRHRMAPEIGSKIDRATQTGHLRVYAGRLRSMTPLRHGLQAQIALRNGGGLSLDVQRMINCTGSEEDYSRVPNPLIQDLIERGRVRSTVTGRGLETDRHGALIDFRGDASEWLFTLGPPRVGGLFETTAVPELRIQSEALANTLCSVDYEPKETPVEFYMAAGI